MEENRGELVVSTKAAAAGRKAYLLFSSVFFYLFAVVLMFCKEGFVESFGRDTGPVIWVGGILLFLGLATFFLITARKGFKSYCDVYEKGVVGTTSMTPSDPRAAVQSFELGYDEIVNVTEQGNALVIYTSYTKLEVLALKNRAEAVQAIRKRMKGRK